jgi:hypothetical protein
VGSRSGESASKDLDEEEGVRGELVTRAIRSHQLWLTVAYVAAMLLLAHAYA